MYDLIHLNIIIIPFVTHSKYFFNGHISWLLISWPGPGLPGPGEVVKWPDAMILIIMQVKDVFVLLEAES